MFVNLAVHSRDAGPGSRDVEAWFVILETRENDAKMSHVESTPQQTGN